jgi:glycosyltransferase involved in cell wall biosynthesis
MKRAILLCIRTLGSGGTERQAAAAALGLRQLGYSVHVCCGEDGGFRADELRAAGIPIFVNPVQGLYYPSTMRAARRLLAYLREHAIGLVHAFDFPMNIFAAPVARWAGTRVLTSQRCFRDTIPPKYHRLLRWTHSLAHGVVVNSREVADHLVSDYGVRRENIELCYNGIDLRTFHPMPREPAGHVVAGTVSVLRPEKGLEDLVHAAALLRLEFPGVEWVLAGSGPEESRLKDLAKRSGPDQTIRFPGATRDVARQMRELDVFVLPSHSKRSNALMEAMACGCAVAASRVGGNPELVTDGVTGVLFPPRNPEAMAAALRPLLSQPELRNRLATAASSRIAAEFSQAAAAQTMAQIYERHFGRQRS